MSFDVLQDKIRAMKNPTVAGLDARIEYVPEHIRKAAFEEHGVGLKGAAEAIWQFNAGLIDALCDIVPAVKPQAAYYENLGWQGMEVLERTIKYAKEKGLFVIADIKRGDIGSTAAAYAEGWLSGAKIEGQVFKSFDADCVTLNGYMGSDSIKPFLEAAKGEDKCVFVLVKTSNPGSGELQDIVAGDRLVYQVMGDLNERIAGRCASAWKRPSSWCPATAPRGERRTMCSTPLTSTATGLSSTPHGGSCAPGRRRGATATTSPRPPGTPPWLCGTISGSL